MFPTFDLDTWANKPFQSDAEQIAAMRRSEYRDPMNQAYRDAVVKKLAMTDTSSISIRVGARAAIEELDSLAEIHQTEEGKAQAESIRQAETTAAENFGEQAVRPRATDPETRRQQEAREAELELGRLYGSQAVGPTRQAKRVDPSSGYGFQTPEE